MLAALVVLGVIIFFIGIIGLVIIIGSPRD